MHTKPLKQELGKDWSNVVGNIKIIKCENKTATYEVLNLHGF